MVQEDQVPRFATQIRMCPNYNADVQEARPYEWGYRGRSRMGMTRRDGRSIWDDRLDLLIARIDRILER